MPHDITRTGLPHRITLAVGPSGAGARNNPCSALLHGQVEGAHIRSALKQGARLGACCLDAVGTSSVQCPCHATSCMPCHLVRARGPRLGHRLALSNSPRQTCPDLNFNTYPNFNPFPNFVPNPNKTPRALLRLGYSAGRAQSCFLTAYTYIYTTPHCTSPPPDTLHPTPCSHTLLMHMRMVKCAAS